jgi:hypothetical protein
MLAWAALRSDQDWLRTEYGSLFNVRNRVYSYLATLYCEPPCGFEWLLAVAWWGDSIGTASSAGSLATLGQAPDSWPPIPAPPGWDCDSRGNGRSGAGVHIQGVTLGGDSHEGYPVVNVGARLYPSSVIFGNVVLRNSRVDAGVIVRRDVSDNAALRAISNAPKQP